MTLNNNLAQDAPIGIFDSGLGGLTVVEALHRFLPHENILYYGDSLHLPYGNQSKTNLMIFFQQIVTFLKNRSVKLIFIACNSATSAVYPLLKTPQNPLILNVIDPLVSTLSELIKQKSLKNIGLIGTKCTIETGIFNQFFPQTTVTMHPLMIPTLASIIENFQDPTATLQEYLNQLPTIELLALACTHYPWIKQHFENFYHHQIPIIDATLASIKQIETVLNQQHLLNNATSLGKVELFWSKLTPKIKRFVNQLPLNLTQLVEKPLT